MPIGQGTRVGPYTVIALLGEGGMGRVWRAHHTTLERDDALKVLPDAFARDDERLARFVREAQVVASLNHPNIAIIYGLEESDGIKALVLELVEGPTLADRLARGPLPLNESLSIASQIVEGLEAAHDKGIVHRDLKPSNIKVRADGAVKLLDFGLAKLVDPQGGLHGDVSALTHVSTVAVSMPGVVRGTAAYMSPEQARGQAVDARTDIWAFGCVLYEMLTGRAAFRGSSVSDTIAAVLTGEPDWALLPSQTPDSVRRLLRRCLQKNTKRRLRAIADAGIELEDSVSTEAHASGETTARHGGRKQLAWGVAALCLVLLALGAVAVYRMPTRESGRVVQFQLSVPPSQSLANRGDAISPDGTRLAFVAEGPTGADVLWVRRLDTLEATPLAGTEGAYSPFWSPDSDSMAFFSNGQLKRTPASGGDVQVLCDVVAPASHPAGAWGADDTIIFAQSFGPIHKVSAQGGEIFPVTTLNEGRQEFGHYNPAFFPDGVHFAYEVGALPERLGIHVGSLASSESSRLMPRSVWPFAIASTGLLLVIDDGVLRAQRLDQDRLQTVGESTVVASGVASVSASSSAIVYRTARSARTRLTWFDRAGKPLGTVGPPGNYLAPMLSPDQSKVAVSRDGDIWVLDLAREAEFRLTSEAASEMWPLWSPDGSEIIYSGGVFGNLRRRSSSGVGGEEVILDTGAIPWSWSADGRFITYAVGNTRTFLDVYVLPLFGARKPQLYLQTRFQDVDSALSPDSGRMAYSSSLSGRPEIYVQTFPSTQERWQISTGGGEQPSWRADGRELYYIDPARRLMAVDITTSPIFRASLPRPLFQTASPPDGRNRYVASRDGQRFLVNTFVEQARPEIVVQLNWAAAISN